MTAKTVPTLTAENQYPPTIPIEIYADTQLEWFAEPRFNILSVVVVDSDDHYDGAGRERYAIVGIKYLGDNQYLYVLKPYKTTTDKIKYSADDRWVEEEELILEAEEYWLLQNQDSGTPF